jgi:hypothetical protein
MARYPAMASGPDEEPAKGPDPAGQSAVGPAPGTKDAGRRRVLPPFRPDIDLERYAVTDGIEIRGFDKQLMADALETARRLSCQTAELSTFAERDRVRTVARYLARESERTGVFQYKTAFRRANVDTYINHLSTRQTSRSVRKVQGQLHDVGRLLYPREYPARQSLAATHVKRIQAASPAQVRDFYALAPTLPVAQSQRLFTVLDLCYGAGARAADFKVLRGSSITEDSWDGQPVAIVRLPNRAGGTRLVPAADVDISQRLLTLAGRKRSNYLLSTADGDVERNACNRVGEHLRAQGHRNINVAALRNRWLLEVAVHVPAALMLQLADVNTAQILSDQRDQLPTYGLQHSIALTKENHQ